MARLIAMTLYKIDRCASESGCPDEANYFILLFDRGRIMHIR